MKLGIREKLYVGFGAIILLLALVGAVGWWNTKSLSTGAGRIYNNNVKGAVALANANSDLWKLRYGFPQYLVLGPEDRAKIREEEPKLYQQINEQMKVYASTELTPEERTVLAEWNDIFPKYTQARPRWFELQDAGKPEEAAAWRAATTTPFGAGSVKALTNLISLQQKAGQEVYGQIEANGQRSNTLMIGLAALALLVGAVVSFMLGRKLSQPIREAAAVADQLAKGDLSADIKVTTTDETGQLLRSMQQMTEYFKEMADVSDRVAAGNLAVRVEPRSAEDRFGVSFRKMTQYLGEMAAVADRIAAGDLSARVTPKSAEDRFGASFKNMLDNTLNLVQSKDERDHIQRSVMKLLDEVGNVANGDLTVEAEVTADMTGAIADAFNFMIAELRRVITNVQHAALQVSASADEINSTTERLAGGSATQAKQLVDTSSAIEEMAVSIQQVSENATLSAAVADQALANAKQGAGAVQNNITAMTRIRSQVQETSKRIKRLGERSQEIGEIVQMINDIADRTSMLALNASIQAAMAGEAGRGFAVVAEEVERLAERSTNATKQIAALVKSIQGETNEAVAAMEDTTREVVDGSSLANEAGQALGEIEAVSHRLADLLQSISQASQQQARGSEELAKSMGSISDVTQQVATGSKQAATSVRGLVSLADGLRGTVVTFKLPGTNGNGNGHHAPYSNN